MIGKILFGLVDGNLRILHSRTACFAVIDDHVIQRPIAYSLVYLNAGTQIALNCNVNLVSCAQLMWQMYNDSYIEVAWGQYVVHIELLTRSIYFGQHAIV